MPFTQGPASWGVGKADAELQKGAHGFLSTTTKTPRTHSTERNREELRKRGAFACQAMTHPNNRGEKGVAQNDHGTKRGRARGPSYAQRMRLRHEGTQGELPFHEIARRIARNDVGENVALAVLHSIETDMPAHPAVRV